MMAVQAELVINKPQEEVFAYLADITKHPEWGNPSHKLQVRKTSEGPLGQGSTFDCEGDQFGHNTDSVTITEYTPNSRIAYQADGNAGLIGYAFDLAPADGGTRVTKTFDAIKPKFPLNILAPVVNAFIQPGAMKGDLERIKANLEGS
jgi:uncharacterized protein YndB with AHSA1/START domain